MNLQTTEWSATGPEEDPKVQLHATFMVGGCMMHLEAVAVTEELQVDGVTMGQYYDDAPDWIQEAIDVSANGEPVQTVKIQGRRYILIATPGQR